MTAPVRDRFSPSGLLIVVARLHGPAGLQRARVMVDTGASYTVLPMSLLEAAGYAADAAIREQAIVTASGMERVPLFRVEALEALQRVRPGHTVLAHDLPVESGVDGLLGLDFFRGSRLTVDFRSGTIELA